MPGVDHHLVAAGLQLAGERHHREGVAGLAERAERDAQRGARRPRRGWGEVVNAAEKALRQLQTASSPGRMNGISGMMQYGERPSSIFTAEAMSSGRIICSAGHALLRELRHRRLDEPGAERGGVHAARPSSLFIEIVRLRTAAFVAL